MGFSIEKAARRVSAGLRAGVFAIMAATLGSAPSPVGAQTDISFQTAPLVIRNDRGGLLRDRLRQLAELRLQGRRVEIRGAVCLSTCTMFLGLPGTCISPSTTFGFHGPSSYGRALDPATFESASHIIADHYPPALRQWYLNTARYSIRRMHRGSGQNLINMGLRAC